MLEDNGICGIILPDGSELSNKSYYIMRKYLIDNCKILKVINVSSGAFNSTGVKTKILIFKKQKGIDNHKNIEFFDINKDCNEIKLIAIADLDKNYSFKLNQVNQENIKYNNDVEIKTIGQVCKVNQGTYITKNMKISGDYPVYGGGNISYYINQYNREDDIIIAKDGISANCIRYEKNKFFLNHHGWTLIFKDDTIIKKYMFYYLQLIQPELLSIAKGMAQLGINQENFYNIKIPIPPIEKQEELVKRIDIFENANKDIINLIDNLKEFNKIKIESLINKDIEIKTLSEVCTFKNGTNITKDKLINGNYPVIGGGQNPLGYHNKYNVVENTILISKDGSYAGYISKYNSKIFLSNHGIYIDTINDIILKDYIYYYLKYIQNSIYKLQSGAGQPGIKKEQLELLEISIPSIEIQKEIIEYCDNNIKIIENLNKTIEGNKKIIKDIITSI
jgi:hypothetical protein